MSKFKTLPSGQVGLIKQLEDGRIVQVGLTAEQSEQLQIFLGILSKTHPLVEMGENWELKFKNKTQ